MASARKLCTFSRATYQISTFWYKSPKVLLLRIQLCGQTRFKVQPKITLRFERKGLEFDPQKFRSFKVRNYSVQLKIIVRQKKCDFPYFGAFLLQCALSAEGNNMFNFRSCRCCFLVIPYYREESEYVISRTPASDSIKSDDPDLKTCILVTVALCWGWKE